MKEGGLARTNASEERKKNYYNNNTPSGFGIVFLLFSIIMSPLRGLARIIHNPYHGTSMSNIMLTKQWFFKLLTLELERFSTCGRINDKYSIHLS